MSSNLKNKLKHRLKEVYAEKPNLIIGKSGISEAILKEIERQLGINHVIKIKFLSNFLTEDFQADIDKIIKKTKSSLVDKRGKTIIIYRQRRPSV
ncbi:MAG: YhbY family RNA-binding protein [Candidatus Heimdallarchaeota archaeon]